MFRKNRTTERVWVLPERLKAARKSIGYTQAEVAKEAGFGLQTISRFERGVRAPDAHTLVFLADFYGVDVSWLLGTDDSETRLSREEAAAIRLLRAMSLDQRKRLRELLLAFVLPEDSQ